MNQVQTQEPTPESTPTKGISGLRFLLLSLAVLVGLFALGTFLGNNAAANQELGRNFLRFFIEFAERVFAFTVLAMILNGIFFFAVLDSSIFALPRYMKIAGNHSYMILFGSFVLVAAIMIIGAHGTNLREYLTVLLQQGSAGLFLAGAFTIVVAYLFGVRSLDEFAVWVCQTPNNDNHSIFVSVIFVSSMLIAMSV